MPSIIFVYIDVASFLWHALKKVKIFIMEKGKRKIGKKVVKKKKQIRITPF